MGKVFFCEVERYRKAPELVTKTLLVLVLQSNTSPTEDAFLLAANYTLPSELSLEKEPYCLLTVLLLTEIVLR